MRGYPAIHGLAKRVAMRWFNAASYRGTDFTVEGEIGQIERIPGIRVRNRLYGRARWRKMKGVARIRYDNGTTRTAEIHWYEAHGKGRVAFKVKD